MFQTTNQLLLIYPFELVFFHCFFYVYQRVTGGLPIRPAKAPAAAGLAQVLALRPPVQLRHTTGAHRLLPGEAGDGMGWQGNGWNGDK